MKKKIISFFLCFALFTAFTGCTLVPGKEDTADGENTEYIVSAPVEMDRKTAIKILRKLAKENDDAREIVANKDEYSDELLIAAANNPEKLPFVRKYPDCAMREATVYYTQDELDAEFPLLLQWDERWGYYPYGSSVVGMTGCGPTVMAMAILALTDITDATPDNLAAWSQEEGYSVTGSGTSWTFISGCAGEYGIQCRELPLWRETMEQELDAGKIIICVMREGDFTTGGHYIMIYGYDSEGFLVNDPNCVYRSGCKWSYDRIESQISNLWALG